ncbi:MAG: PfkB family carbohydrate kinase [Candidatus Faecousia sp.]|nr:PfkB family carbohydrate kinase [Candidatus Faecousia sp.]
MAYKRILTIQDLSCVGQCSLTVALPVLSACGHETCVLPTALLSTHTGGFGAPVIVPLSDSLPEIAGHWRQNGITFDAVLTGYLGNIPSVRMAEQIMDTFLKPGGLRIVDPAMADHGRLYSGLNETYVAAMRELCAGADIILPNLTEAALLSGQPCRETSDIAYADSLLDALPNTRVLLTGVGEGETGFLLRDGGERKRYAHPRLPGSFSGTGDIFAAAFTGAWMAGKGLYDSARIAEDFTWKCIAGTVAAPAHWYGVKFEPALPELIRMLG